jgi:hypothetical protein
MLGCKAAVQVTAFAIATTAVAVATSSGCSFLFVEAPPRDHASRRYFDCTSSYLAPGVDSALGGLLAIGVLGSMSDTNTESQAIVEGTIVAGAALASATYGFLRASHCREAKQALAERVLEPPQLMAPPPPPPFPPPAGTAPPPPTSRDPWLSEGVPPAGGCWGGGAMPAPAEAGRPDAGGADR